MLLVSLVWRSVDLLVRLGDTEYCSPLGRCARTIPAHQGRILRLLEVLRMD